MYVMPDFKIALTMLKEQADVAAESSLGILVEVMRAGQNAMSNVLPILGSG